MFQIRSALSPSSGVTIGQVVLPNPISAAFPPPSGFGYTRDSYVPAVSESGNMLCGIVVFEGLSPLASVDVKDRMHLECTVAKPGQLTFTSSPGTADFTGPSPVLPFAHKPPMVDTMALEFVSAMGQRLPPAYPASANDLSKIWNWVKKTVKFLAPVIKPFSQPFVGAASLLPLGIGDAVNSFAEETGLA
jgi:hypothetical protein